MLVRNSKKTGCLLCQTQYIVVYMSPRMFVCGSRDRRKWRRVLVCASRNCPKGYTQLTEAHTEHTIQLARPSDLTTLRDKSVSQIETFYHKLGLTQGRFARSPHMSQTLVMWYGTIPPIDLKDLMSRRVTFRRRTGRSGHPRCLSDTGDTAVLTYHVST